MNQRPVPQLTEALCAILRDSATLGLATVDERGEPWAVNVNFVFDDALDLYFISSPDSAHAHHIVARPLVAAAAYAPFHDTASIRGVQLRGSCTLTDPTDMPRLWAMLCDRFPAARALEHRLATERFYRIRPNWFRVIDNTVRFGFKQESRWPAP